ncbi:MAG: hypothetical protein KAI83_10820 [Thiomargarita sp.]|nr:hypothetical protein [Thiomargarita sp.]
MNNFVFMFSRRTLLTFNLLILSYSFLASVATCSVVGEDHFCVIQADNTVVCWGSNSEGQTMPPSGTFLQVSAGGYHSCGIRTDKTVACWGLNEDGQATPLSGTFLQISAGLWHNCGVKTDNTLACWGSNDPYWRQGEPQKEDPYLNEWKHVKTLGQAEPPSGTFLQVSAGGRHSCGVRTNHTVSCWGSHLSDPGILIGKLGNSQSIPLSGEFSQVGAGPNYTCGIRPEQKIECWGGFGKIQPPSNTFYSQVPGGGRGRCALKTDHTIVCFNIQDLPGSEGIRIPNSTCRCPIPGMTGNLCACTTSPNHTFSQILDVGNTSNCGVRTNNTVVCWGYDPEGQTFTPRGLIAKSSEPACLLYGVHNNEKETQFFIININTGNLDVHVRSRLDENHNIDALDIDPSNNQLYAASVEGSLYKVRNGAQVITEIGKMGFANIEALSFHSDGSLWGWAQGTGLFQVDKGENNELNLPGKVIIPYTGDIKLEDVTWNTEGTILYAVENLEQGSRLWAYDKSRNEVNFVCPELMGSLKTKVNALETLQNNTLAFVFEEKKNLAYGVINVQTCEMTTSGEIATVYNQVKGIAWPDCRHGDAVK